MPSRIRSSASFESLAPYATREATAAASPAAPKESTPSKAVDLHIEETFLARLIRRAKTDGVRQEKGSIHQSFLLDCRQPSVRAGVRAGTAVGSGARTHTRAR